MQFFFCFSIVKYSLDQIFEFKIERLISQTPNRSKSPASVNSNIIWIFSSRSFLKWLTNLKNLSDYLGFGKKPFFMQKKWRRKLQLSSAKTTGGHIARQTLDEWYVLLMFYSRIFFKWAVIFHGNGLNNALVAVIGKFGGTDLLRHLLMVSVQQYG